jgi:signal transduction histidine kinase
VVYSDEPRLIGTHHKVDDEELAALRGDGVDAHVSDLSRPENRFERRHEKLLEVYMPIRATNGEPLLFETYLPFKEVADSGRRLWLGFAPAVVGGLLLLQLVNLPLARSLARRLREGQREREALLHRALDASQTERRLIAADLHDGIVQDLVGVSFSLAAQGERMNGHGDAAAGAALKAGAAQTRHSIRALRALLIDIYPPSLHQAGLSAALSDLATIYTSRGLRTTVEIPDDLQPVTTTERLLFRCAQEALRNVQKHASADSVSIRVQAGNPHVVLEITDDGRGFEPALLDARAEHGHFGLRLLSDLVEDAGGRVDVRSSPGAGTTIRVEVPR